MKLFDAYDRVVDTGLLKTEQAYPTFAGVRNIFSSLYPSTGLTPERLTGILRNADFGDPFLFLELAEEIEEKDSHYTAVLNKRKGAVTSLELLVQSASEDPREEGIADFLRDILTNESSFNLSDQLYDIQDAVGKGFSATEIEWDTEKRLKGDLWWVPKQLHWRDPRWFMFDWISGRQVLVRTLHGDGRTIELAKAADRRTDMTKDGGQHWRPGGNSGTWIWNTEAEKLGIQPLTEPLHPYKFITHFGRAKSGLPMRGGLTRCIAWIYLFKNYATKDWSTFVSRYGLPIRLGKYTPGASDADKQALLAAASGLGSDMAAIIPASMELALEGVTDMAGSVDVYRTYMEYLNDLESKLVLGSTLGTETRGEGSRAASQTHRDVERDIMEADVKRLETSVNRDLIRPIVDLNYGRPPNGVYPRLRIGLPDNDDVSAWVKNVKDLAESGMKIGVKNIYEKMHLTAPEEGEPVLTPPERVTVTDDEKSPSGKPPLGKPPAGKSGEPAPDKSGDTTEEPTQETSRLNISSREDPHGAADELTETIMARWRPVMGPMVDPVLRAIKQAKSYDDLKGRLKKIAPEMDPSGLRDMMSKALFASLMAGRTGLKLE